MRHSHQLAVAASVGAVVGFGLVILVMTDNAITWCPLLVVPGIAANWKAQCTVQTNAAELQQFLQDFGFMEATSRLQPRLSDRPAFQRRLRQAPRLTRHQRRHVDRWTDELFQRVA